MKNKLVVWFNEVGKEDTKIVGGKGANTGEMVSFDIPVPDGFIVTSNSYYQFLDEAKLTNKIKKELDIDTENPEKLRKASEKIKKEILSTKIPNDIKDEILSAYIKLGQKLVKKETKILNKINKYFKDPLVAIRSSATAEDLANASFAGQQESYLNIKGESNVIQAVRKCWASLFEERAIYYRKENKFDHLKVGIAVLVQHMIESDTSGVMFTINPTTNDKKSIIIESIYGLGEFIVQGTVTPDHYEVNKSSLEITKKEIVTQKIALYKRGTENKKIRLPVKIQNKQKISDKLITEIAKLGKKIEKHYYFPQDIEWAVENNRISIVQTRPITTIKKTEETKKETTQKEINSLEKLPLLLSGSPASPGIAWGQVVIIQSSREITKIKEGDILVTEMTNPDFVPAMKKSAAILTDRGGRTSHAAIVSRELGIPCIVGTEKATKILKNGQTITIDATNGKIYNGTLNLESKKNIINNQKKEIISDPNIKTATKIYVNLGEPSVAPKISKRFVDGIGLLRAEFMIADIGTHPKKLIRDGKSRYFIDKLSENLKIVCENFNPRPVVYRATDFKTNEYRNLIGGKLFEPFEPNPMLGYRGAYRYIHDPEVFALELEAIKKVRNKFGLKNIWLMLPFVRTVKELADVKKLIALNGLSRSPSFKLWMMVEIPSNVILLDKFIEQGIDGVSIGSNDLTMLILGTDRDNSEVAPEFDEQNDAVLWALEKIIKTCHKYKITSSICGQAPSDYPDLVEKLVKWGVTSISVNPDTIEKTRQTVYEAEKKIIK